jgi:hypothetical protein
MESELDMVIAMNNADADRRDKKLEHDPAPFGVMYERMRAMLMFLLNNVQMDMTKFPSEAEEYASIVKELTTLNGSAAPQGSFCEWMPYQQGQAAKTEALEQKLAEKA